MFFNSHSYVISIFFLDEMNEPLLQDPCPVAGGSIVLSQVSLLFPSARLWAPDLFGLMDLRLPVIRHHTHFLESVHLNEWESHQMCEWDNSGCRSLIWSMTSLCHLAVWWTRWCRTDSWSWILHRLTPDAESWASRNPPHLRGNILSQWTEGGHPKNRKVKNDSQKLQS